MITIGLLALATLSAAAPNQADRLTETATKTFLLPPPQPTDNNKGNSNVWASVITQSASATEYFLACETAFTQPDQCDGPFTGVALTQGEKTMGLKLGGTTYRCEYGDETVCNIKTASDAPEETTTLAGADAEKWSTAVTVVAEATPTPTPEDDPNEESDDLGEEVDDLNGEGVNVAKGGFGGGGGGGGRGSSGGKSSSRTGGRGGSNAGVRTTTSLGAVIVALGVMTISF